MLQSVNDLKGYAIVATNGEIGSIEEFYFDDEKLTVRYLVANTGNWLTGKQNLISPFAVTHLDHDTRKIRVNLTMEQVKNSPGIDKHQPVSRQMERIVADYYGDSYYWEFRPDLTAAQLTEANAAASMVKSAGGTGASAAVAAAPDVHLRRMQEVAMYHIAAIDGAIGKVEDFILETDDWTIRYLRVDTTNWLPGKQVLISTLWLGQINWSHGTVNINLTRRQIKDSPDYDKVKQISREYETRLHHHYRDTTAGRTKQFPLKELSER